MSKLENLAALHELTTLGRYGRALTASLAQHDIDVEHFLSAASAQLARRVLAEYGALFVAAPEVAVPPVCVFNDEHQVQEFQRLACWTAEELNGALVELQPAAMSALLDARAAAESQGLNIFPRAGAEAARRSFADTLRLWESRYHPALAHWSGLGALADAEADALRALVIPEQIAAVISLEERGIFFSKDFSKSVFYSVAPPGASQHLSMLAFDVVQFQDARVRATLARHGWFQTVQSDLPHFTYLGFDERELPERGLHRVESCGQFFWIPDTQ